MYVLCNKVFSNYSLAKSYLLIRCYKTKFFLWNTNNTDRNGVNKQNTHTQTHTNTHKHTHTHTHTKHSEKDNTLERVTIKISDIPPIFKTTAGYNYETAAGRYYC